MDFFGIQTKEPRKAGGPVEVFPDFTVGRANDLMVQGGAFYAVWDEEKGLWSRDEYDVQRLVDKEIREFVEKMEADGIACTPKYLRSFGTAGWKNFRTFMKNVSDNSHPLDSRITFANTPVKKKDYASRRLPYDIAEGSISAYDELVSRLYTPEERDKFEWAIGSIIAGDAKNIQKFLVFYGPGGTGKSSVMHIAEKLLGGLVRDGGYVAMFDAKALVGNNSSFATEAFKDNPLLAIQHDGDLSKIEDNAKLNSIVSHETLRVNEKYKATYDTSINAMLFMGTNKAVKITDAKSGLIRRLIDVRPTGEKHEINRYYTLMAQIDFELGAIAHHCLEVYRRLGKNYYNAYRPVEMMLQTDVFFNYVESYYDIFKAQDGTTLTQAYALYKEFCKESELDFVMPRYRFRDELKNYFDEFHDRGFFDGVAARSFYTGFTAQPFKTPMTNAKKNIVTYSLLLEETSSIFDEVCADLPAQYGKADETPQNKWESVTTTLKDLDTTQLHFVKVPEDHIVIDFDIRGKDGEKNLQLNLEAASQWPATYAELSKSGGGVHLHYHYTGPDLAELAPVYSEGVEVKVYRGGSSLRRRLTHCNNVPVATISSGLPFKEKKPMLDAKTIQSEKGLRELIGRNLRKEIHPGTKPSVEFIHKILEDAYNSGMNYDVTDMRSRIMAFANNSTNHALVCLKAVQKMKFKSEVSSAELPAVKPKDDDPVVIFDCEVYPNLFVLCWGYENSDTVVRMINPSPKEVEGLFIFKLVGFNNRKYDNHILWGRMLGYDNQRLYELSKELIANNHNANFGEAYSLSYADIYDFATKKQGLKKWMIEFDMHHMEMDLSWDEPVPEEMIPKVVEYCVNDVLGTKEAWKRCQADFTARQILADMSGLTVNDTTRNHAARIIFGRDRGDAIADQLMYTDLSQEFPGYIYDYGKSTYRGIEVGEGGYVYSEPGIYENVALLDVASMHPTTIIHLNLFGEYTEKFANLYHGRLAIKHALDAWKKAVEHPERRDEFLGKAEGFVAEASRYLPGLEVTEDNAKALSDALKLVINSIYGYTSATFPNPFRDPRNVDNIVAKRGALFMIDLEYFAEERGFQIAHIKTDSVKIPNATPEIIAEVMEFGKRYGYTFEHEKTFDKMCLINDADYVARAGDKWEATGARFSHPMVFKALFSGEAIWFDDMCETKQVTSPSVMYLDFGEDGEIHADNLQHVGRVGRFLPVYADKGGGNLIRVKDGKKYAVSGTKGYKWLEAEMVRVLEVDAVDRLLFEDLLLGIPGGLTEIVNMGYYEDLVHEAQQLIEKFGDYNEFVK